MATRRVAGLLLALVAFTGIGAGVSAAGTSLLALLADRVADERRARAAALVWIMMIAGFIVTTVTVSRLIEPFSYARLVVVTAMVSVTALVVASLSVFRLDRGPQRRRERTTETPFAQAMAEAWGDRLVRRFAIFVFLAMLAYSAQDLILEPFAGGVFHLTPGESTRISGMHQGGMLAGMLLAAAFAVRFGGLPRWAAGGCAASAVAFLLLAASPMTGTIQALQLSVVVLGIANGAFAIGAIGSMMVRARGARAGLMMGIFGAAQAVAYAIGGFLGAVGSDVARALLSSSARGYGAVFVAEAVLFALAALVMPGVRRDAGDRLTLRSPEDGESLLAAIS
jgi:BCD family chlorophyll transporter-like MFS transporter